MDNVVDLQRYWEEKLSTGGKKKRSVKDVPMGLVGEYHPDEVHNQESYCSYCGKRITEGDVCDCGGSLPPAA